jgi:general secretion pathway protein J
MSPHAPPLRGSLPPTPVTRGPWPWCRSRRHSSRGFTLIELLVALAVMAMLALLSWRTIDGMTRTQTRTEERASQLLRLQAALGQWNADLDAITDTQEVDPLDFDGRLLRLTRRDSGETGLDSPGVRVVAWTRANGQWRRWQSAPLQHRDDLARAWQRAALWGQGSVSDDAQRASTDSVVNVAAIDQWQLFYHRGETWANPLSSVGSGDAGSGPGTTDGLPNGVRLVLSLSAGQALQGTLTRDWVRPTLEAGS